MAPKSYANFSMNLLIHAFIDFFQVRKYFMIDEESKQNIQNLQKIIQLSHLIPGQFVFYGVI